MLISIWTIFSQICLGNASAWPNLLSREPNAAHYALKSLEDEGYIHFIITQAK
jgi:NAD-dependent SIR2 family protein deacetylase